jgi:protein O-mannosyl-transferase
LEKINKLHHEIFLKPEILFPLIIAIIAFAVYFLSLFNGFVYDDTGIISDNYFIKNIRNVYTLLSPSKYFLISGEASYRPIATFSYFINFFIWKSNPFGYHLSNVILHVLNCLLVYFIAKNLIKNKIYAFIAGLLFAVQPAFSEAVLCASYNEDLFCLFFLLLSFFIYFKIQKQVSSGRRFYFYCLCFQKKWLFPFRW